MIKASKYSNTLLANVAESIVSFGPFSNWDDLGLVVKLSYN